MRKTYKPLARVEKASQMFRRKTLNVNDELNIRHDDDDIENVDDYWCTAASVIEDSFVDSIDAEDEPSDTLFNINTIRKSLRSARAATQREEAAKLATGQNSAKMKNIHPEDNDSSLVELNIPREQTGGVVDESPVSDDMFNGFEMEAGISSDIQPMEDSENAIKENDLNTNEIKEDMGLKSFGAVKAARAHRAAQASQPVEVEASTSSSQSNQKVSKAKSGSGTKVEAHKPKRGVHSFVIEHPPLTQLKNVVTPLVCSSSVDTATMSLDFMAYVENYKTENAFSLYVIKGKVELTVGGKTKIAPHGSVSVIEKDEVCSINCISKNGATLLLSYAL